MSHLEEKKELSLSQTSYAQILQSLGLPDVMSLLVVQMPSLLNCLFTSLKLWSLKIKCMLIGINRSGNEDTPHAPKLKCSLMVLVEYTLQ